MLTRPGWLVGVGIAALIAGGRLLGLPELYVLGAMAATLLVASALVVGSARLELEVGRSVHPTRVGVGTPTRVEIAVRNTRANRTPVLRLRDPVSGTRGADLLVSPLDRRERRVAAYRLPTDHRGLVGIGPLEVVLGDPFGLVRLATVAAPAVEVIVFPRVDPIDPLPYTTGHDPLAGARRPHALGRTNEDFYALRPYAVGDDLRRIHWPSSARHDELLVRQSELPWQGRTTVLLDVRRAGHTEESIEVAVSAAASVVAATARRRDLIRLVTTAGSDSDFSPGSDHVEAIMEHLAVVPTTASGSLRRAVEMLARRSNGGALVAVLGEITEADGRAIAALHGRFGSVTTVQVDRSAWHPTAPVGVPTAHGGVHVTRDAPFPVAWNTYVRGQRLRRGAPTMAAP